MPKELIHMNLRDNNIEYIPDDLPMNLSVLNVENNPIEYDYKRNIKILYPKHTEVFGTKQRLEEYLQINKQPTSKLTIDNWETIDLT